MRIEDGENLKDNVVCWNSAVEPLKRHNEAYSRKKKARFQEAEKGRALLFTDTSICSTLEGVIR